MREKKEKNSEFPGAANAMGKTLSAERGFYLSKIPSALVVGGGGVLVVVVVCLVVRINIIYFTLLSLSLLSVCFSSDFFLFCTFAAVTAFSVGFVFVTVYPKRLFLLRQS